MPRICYQCEHENPSDQPFCGQCGSPLVLKDFIARQVTDNVRNEVRDRDILETESSIKVFERAWGWVKLLGGIWTGIAVVILALLGWKAIDFWTAIDRAKVAVNSSAAATQKAIETTSAHSVKDIQIASQNAIVANNSSVQKASHLSSDLEATAAKTKGELKMEAASVREEVSASQTQLDAVKKLQPEFDTMRGQLTKATTELAAQQKVISNSEDFVRHVFSTHATYMFTFPTFIQPTSIIVPAPAGVKNSVVYMLLPVTPMEGTIQLQYKIFLQPPNSYFHLHNLLIFFWGDPPENLKQDTLSVSLFPDTSDKELIKTITFKDGRVFADGDPLPKLGMPDPDFKGSKWAPAPKQ